MHLRLGNWVNASFMECLFIFFLLFTTVVQNNTGSHDEEAKENIKRVRHYPCLTNIVIAADVKDNDRKNPNKNSAKVLPHIPRH